MPIIWHWEHLNGGGKYWLSDGLRMFFNFFSICAVDVFILISGWFGIKCSRKGFCKFVFQCAYFLVGAYLVGTCLSGTAPSIKELVNAILIKQWFVQAYMLLYILAPVLNHFADQAEKKVQLRVLLAFFVFELLYDVCFETINVNISHGYSAISFVGLYLLARYVRNFGIPEVFVKCPFKWFVLIVTVETLASFITMKIDVQSLMWKMCYYDSPLNITAALMLLLTFDKLKVQSHFINWVAASCFAVFLLHANNTALVYYTQYARNIFEGYSGAVYLLVIALYMAFWFMVAVLLDQFRIFIWKLIIRNKYVSLWLQQER